MFDRLMRWYPELVCLERNHKIAGICLFIGESPTITSNARAFMDATESLDTSFKIVAKYLFVDPAQTITTDSVSEGNSLGAVCTNLVLVVSHIHAGYGCHVSGGFAFGGNHGRCNNTVTNETSASVVFSMAISIFILYL